MTIELASTRAGVREWTSTRTSTMALGPGTIIHPASPTDMDMDTMLGTRIRISHSNGGIIQVSLRPLTSTVSTRGAAMALDRADVGEAMGVEMEGIVEVAMGMVEDGVEDADKPGRQLLFLLGISQLPCVVLPS